MIEVDPKKANYALKNKYGETGVIHKLAGESVNAGVFTFDGSNQIIIGAPKANSLQGKVYICGGRFKPSLRRMLISLMGRTLKLVVALIFLSPYFI